MSFYGQVAYDVYRERVGGMSFVTGTPLPEYGELPESVQDAWTAAADEVIAEYAGDEEDDDDWDDEDDWEEDDDDFDDDDEDVRRDDDEDPWDV